MRMKLRAIPAEMPMRPSVKLDAALGNALGLLSSSHILNTIESLSDFRGFTGDTHAAEEGQEKYPTVKGR